MKKYLTITCMLLILCGCDSLNRKQALVSEDDLRQAVLAFTELEERLKEEDGKLWNHKLEGPLMLVNPETRMLIANEQDAKGELKKQGDLYTGMLPENINIANTAFSWNGKYWTMVFLPLPDTKEGRLRLLIHESFHRIQPETGFDNMTEKQSTHLDTKEGRILLRLEMEALKQALLSDDPGQHIRDALLFRQYRHQVFEGSEEAENSLEIIEGLAEYTGIILSGMSDDSLRNHFVSQIGELISLPTYVRSFAYYEFPVYGYFMRQHDEKWNLKVNKNTSLTDFICEVLNVDVTAPTREDVILTGKAYDFQSISSSEEKRELKRLDLVKKYTERLLGERTVRLSLENMSVGFNPSNLVPLDTFGTVYPNLRITDNWGILEVDSCGALLSPDWQMVTVSYPETMSDTLFTGMGWRLRLNVGWKLEPDGAGYRVIKE